MARAAWRSRRATRWRSTADPTGLAMISPTRGPVASSGARRTCTTISGCAARTPYLTAASNSVDRLMRLRAESTAERPGAAIRQLTRGGLCAAGWRRSIARHGCASASGNRALGLGADYSAGRSACPWPRRSPRIRTIRPLTSFVRGSVGGWSCCWPARSPCLVWVAAVSPTFGRLFEGTDAPSLGQTWSAATHPTHTSVKTGVLDAVPAAP